MADTTNLTLPLLAASQAQKHVTVNEALTRLDGMVQLTLRSRSLTTPPATVLEGECFGVPAGAINDWAGHDGEVAQFANGGWVFTSPARGWRAFVSDTGSLDLHDGTGWVAGGQSASPGGAGVQLRTVEADIPISAGPTVATGLVFPPRAIVLGVTGRVTTAITGALTDWRAGDAGSDARYGNGLGLALDSWLGGPADPFVVWTPTEILLTGNGGDFAAGAVRLAAHYLELGIPDPA